MDEVHCEYSLNCVSPHISAQHHLMCSIHTKVDDQGEIAAMPMSASPSGGETGLHTIEWQLEKGR